MQSYLLAIDQGTTNSRAILFNQAGNVVSQYEMALSQSFPQDGWVEQDPNEMYEHTIICCQQALARANVTASSVAAIGIANQRETTIMWEKSSGLVIYPAIVWQDRRTSDMCEALSHLPIAQSITEKTGLRIDPYFSATKIMWLLENVEGARKKAEQGELLFGTIDTYFLWRLTGGKVHATDATNASRTLLFNIRAQRWDQEILTAFNIPAKLLPEVLDNTANFGETEKDIFGASIKIAAMAGDQQAATVGQACFEKGMIKVTYGTGCFMVLNTGNEIVTSHHELLSTVAYRINNKVTYGLEGSIFSAGVTVKWLRDTLKIIRTAAETENLAESVADTGGVYLVPAFTGLGAPYWDPKARAAILGLTRNSQREHIVRAALESVAYQTRDLLQSMKSDYHHDLAVLRVDGGMSNNQWLMMFIASVLGLEVQRPDCVETTALGVAYLAGLQVGIFTSLDDIAARWRMNASFKPAIEEAQCEQWYQGWLQAVASVLTN